MGQLPGPEPTLLDYGVLGALVLIVGLWTWERRQERNAQIEEYKVVIQRNTAALSETSKQLALLAEAMRRVERSS